MTDQPHGSSPTGPTNTKHGHPSGPSTGTGGDGESSRGSLGEILTDLTENFSTLVRQEIALAKAEVKETASAAGKGAGMFAGAGVAGHFVLIFLSLTLMFGLANLLGYTWSALIVAGVWAVIAAVLALVGKKELKSAKGLPHTAASLQQIPPTMKPNEDTP